MVYFWGFARLGLATSVKVDTLHSVRRATRPEREILCATQRNATRHDVLRFHSLVRKHCDWLVCFAPGQASWCILSIVREAASVLRIFFVIRPSGAPVASRRMFCAAIYRIDDSNRAQARSSGEPSPTPYSRRIPASSENCQKTIILPLCRKVFRCGIKPISGS